MNSAFSVFRPTHLITILAIALALLSMLPAVTRGQDSAAGVIILKPYPEATDSGLFKASEYVSYEGRGTGRASLHEVGKEPRSINPAQVVEAIPYPAANVTNELANDQDLAQLRAEIQRLETAVGEHPKSRSFLQPKLEQLLEFEEKFNSGLRRQGGRWISKDELMTITLRNGQTREITSAEPENEFTLRCDSSSGVLRFSVFELAEEELEKYFPELASDWQAADNGDQEAMRKMALLGYNNPEEGARFAETFFARLGEGGDAKALYRLGLMYQNAIGITRDRPRAAAAFENAALAGFVPGMLNTGFAEFAGYRGEQDTEKALEWFDRAAQAGDPSGIYVAALIRAFNPADEVAETEDEAMAEVKRAAGLNHFYALFDHAMFLISESGSRKDEVDEEAKDLIVRSSSLECPSAMNWLGAFLYGQNNEPEAKGMFERAAVLGYPPARYNLALLEIHGVTGTADSTEAQRLFEGAKNMGQAERYLQDIADGDTFAPDNLTKSALVVENEVPWELRDLGDNLKAEDAQDLALRMRLTYVRRKVEENFLPGGSGEYKISEPAETEEPEEVDEAADEEEDTEASETQAEEGSETEEVEGSESEQPAPEAEPTAEEILQE